MFKKHQVMLSSVVATILLFVATTNVHTFKWFILFEPETPEVLK